MRRISTRTRRQDPELLSRAFHARDGALFVFGKCRHEEESMLSPRAS
jgi:hypothetical protein